MTHSPSELENRFQKFKSTALALKGMTHRMANNYAERCESDLFRLLNSFTLSLLEWCDQVGLFVDEKSLSVHDTGTVDGQFKAFIELAHVVHNSGSIRPEILTQRSETSLKQVITDHYLNCYDLIIMLGGKIPEATEVET